MAPKPKPWFRFYVEAVHDRKLRRLRPEYRWLFVACLAAARQSNEPGWLFVGDGDPMGWGDLCDWAGMPLRQVEKGTDALKDVGVLGFDVERSCWFVPSWSQRQFESDVSTERVNKHRSRNGVATADATAPETETDTDLPSPSAEVKRPLAASFLPGTGRVADKPSLPEEAAPMPDELKNRHGRGASRASEGVSV